LRKKVSDHVLELRELWQNRPGAVGLVQNPGQPRCTASAAIFY
jgi:hypothetical protein